MILPPTLFLQSVRVAGSVLFLVGLATFTVCALQVYLGKIFKWGIAAKGLYRYIRHPQYLALGLWGIGMAILWPRFIVLATLSVMFVLYYFLAKDEERRMLSQYGDSYRHYMNTTGMFLPRVLEAPCAALGRRLFPATAIKYLAIPVLIVTLVMGSGFLLREITLRSLPLATSGNLTLVPILPEDRGLDGQILNGIIAAAAAGEAPFLKGDKILPGLRHARGLHHAGDDRRYRGPGPPLQAPPHRGPDHRLGLPPLRPLETAPGGPHGGHARGGPRRGPAAPLPGGAEPGGPGLRHLHHPAGDPGGSRPRLRVNPCPGASLLAGGATRTPVGFIDLDAKDGQNHPCEAGGQKHRLEGRAHAGDLILITLPSPCPQTLSSPRA